MAKLLYQGHGSFRMTTDGGVTVYIDPFAGEGYDLPADLILVTHQHHDHNCIDLPPHKAGCGVIQNFDALKDGKYNSFDVPGLHIEAVEAYNKNHDRSQCVGYLITVNGKLLYFAGDTSTTGQMSELAERNIDWAFLPTDGIYNMDIPEAMECARTIGAKHTVPVHMAPGKLFDMKKAKKFTVPGAYILEPGQELDI